MAAEKVAPPFLGPPEEPMLPETQLPEGNEFLELLKKAMPPGASVPSAIGNEWSRPTFTTPEGDLMGLTENDSATYLSSGNACLDFFFQVVPSTRESRLVSLLKKAWRENPLQALKLVFHLRDVRGTGKSDRERFYYSAIWLHNAHPATLLENLPLVAEFGYFKDLLQLLLRLVEGPEEAAAKEDVKKRHKQTVEAGKMREKSWLKHLERCAKDGTDKQTSRRESMVGLQSRKDSSAGYYARKGAAAREAKAHGTLKPRAERIADSLAADQSAKEKAAKLRTEKKLALARRVGKIYPRDPKFQALYLQVAKLFAVRLKEDVKALEEGRLHDISLAAKWTPSLNSSYDLRTLICYAIATQIFPKEAHPEYEGIDNQKYGFVVRERLRKELLVPLRKALEIPEVSMSAQKWGEVNYQRVASVAMKNYNRFFLQHDTERFTKFLEDVKSGKVKIAAGALFPHEILRDSIIGGETAEVAELQWKRMVLDLKEKGSLCNCIAVCDVSGSMTGEPMDVCIALGILLSDLSDEPWKGHVITFSHTPQIHLVKGESLQEKFEFTRHMDWGMNTDFQLVFDRILAMAQSARLTPGKMIKRLFVFSDMEFDESSNSDWETDYSTICLKYEAAGFGLPPEIVFWNLRDSSSTPVLKSQAGVAMVSGFSKNILKIFLQGDGVINPIAIMEQAIEAEVYSKLKVVD